MVFASNQTYDEFLDVAMTITVAYARRRLGAKRGERVVNKHYTAKPVNEFVYFISPNPITVDQPYMKEPTIEEGAFIGPFSSVIGDVTIRQGVFVAPQVSVRADEGTPFYIGEGTNLQDGVILHGLKNEHIRVHGIDYSIYIGRSVSITHGAIVHGPAYIGDGSFVGFQSLVYQAIVGQDVFIGHNAVVTGKIKVPDGRFIPPGAIIDTQLKADQLGPRPDDEEQFAQAVQQVNQAFASSYSLMFGRTRCSCGLACSI